MIVRRDSVEPFDYGGLEILDYTAGLDSRSSFAVISVPPGAAHAEAWSRRSDKYYYIVAGTVELTLDAQTEVLTAGDFCVVAQGRHFSYRNRDPVEARMCLVHTPCFDPAAEVTAGDSQP